MPDSRNQQVTLAQYSPARYVDTSKNSFISYYALNPETGRLKHVRLKVNRIKNSRERRKFANGLIRKINLKLENGWNPFIEQDQPQAFRTIDRKLAGKMFRPDTKRSYMSAVNLFKKWIKAATRRD